MDNLGCLTFSNQECDISHEVEREQENVDEDNVEVESEQEDVDDDVESEDIRTDQISDSRLKSLAGLDKNSNIIEPTTNRSSNGHYDLRSHITLPKRYQ